MPIQTKICGISTFDAADAVVDGGADFLGLIFFDKSPRHISIDQAEVLGTHVDGKVDVVAVTVNAKDTYLDAIVRAAKPTHLQLHGTESPDRVTELKRRYSLPVIKAFAIRDAQDFEKTKVYNGAADLFLFDAKPPAGSQLPGGNGISFDWEMLPTHTKGTDYMLSGGLSIDNIEEALRQSGAHMIDISSGVESSPGVKNCSKIDALLKRVKDIG